MALEKLTLKGYVYLRDNFDRIHAIMREIDSNKSSSSDLEEAIEEVLKGSFQRINYFI
jgi:hypothetical protein